MTTPFKVYDKVWVMCANKPTELTVFAVVESADFPKSGTDTEYHLVSSMCGAGWGNNEGLAIPAAEVFASKEALIASL